MPREQWDGLLHGEGCALCRDMDVRMKPNYVDRYGHTITTPFLPEEPVVATERKLLDRVERIRAVL
jgi:hypothetical protein